MPPAGINGIWHLHSAGNDEHTTTPHPCPCIRPAVGGHPALRADLLEYSSSLWPDLASGDVALSGGDVDLTSGACSSGACGGDGKVDVAPRTVAQPPRGVPAAPGTPAADFQAWAAEQGVGGAVEIASFGALRGCAAVRDVAPGEPLLSIPAQVLIYEDTVRQTDLVGRLGP